MDVYTKGYTMCEPVIVLAENTVPQNCTQMQYLSKCLCKCECKCYVSVWLKDGFVKH